MPVENGVAVALCSRCGSTDEPNRTKPLVMEMHACVS